MNRVIRALEFILLSLTLAGSSLLAVTCEAASVAGTETENGESDPSRLAPPHFVLEESLISVQVRPTNAVLGQPVYIYGSLTSPLGEGLPGRGIQITVLSPQGTSEILTTSTDTNGDYALVFAAPTAGAGWEVASSWAGDLSYNGATSEPPAFFDVMPADAWVTIFSSAYSVRQSDLISLFGRVKPTTQVPDAGVLEGLEVHLMLDDGGTGSRLASGVTDALGDYRFQDVSLPGIGMWKLWVEFSGSSDLNPSISKTIAIQVRDTPGHAILVAGKGDDDTRVQIHNRSTDTIYRKLRQRGFEPDNIFYLRFGIPDDNGILVDGEPSEAAIRYAVTTWAKDRLLTEPAPLFIVFVGSGQPMLFQVSGENEGLTPWQLDGWITNLEGALVGSDAEGQPKTFIYGAPYSGSFIPRLSRKGRVRAIITSSDANELPVTGPEEDGAARQGDFFVLQLFESLWQGRSLTQSFEAAVAATQAFTNNEDGNGLSEGFAYLDRAGQHALLDDNGDDVGSFGFLSGRAGDDGFLSARIFLGFGVPPPEARIIQVPPKQVIAVGEYPDLWAKVTNTDASEAVWMVITPPFFSLGVVWGDPWIHRDVDGLHVPLFDPDQDGIYTTTAYPDFSQVGTHRVLFFVKDEVTGQLGEVWKTKVVVLDPGSPLPGEFTLLSPADGDTVGEQVLLEWSSSQKGLPEDTITYALQVAADPLFEQIILEREDIEGTSFLIGGNAGLLDRAVYYWRVKAESFFGKTRFGRGGPMMSTDIGRSVEGDTQYDGLTDSYTILGNGLGNFGANDQFRFVHTVAKGNFEVSARLNSLNGTDGPSFAGIMIRSSTDEDSPYAMLAMNPEGQLFFAFRRAPGALPIIEQRGTERFPGYVKLVCVREWASPLAEITPYFSEDGKTWTSSKPSTLQLPNMVHVGISVTSGDAENLVKAIVDEFTVSPLTDRGGNAPGSLSDESEIKTLAPPSESLATEYSTFQTNFGAGLPGYNVLTVLVYNQNDPSQSPPGTTITISPIVGTINNWIYSGYLPVGQYTINVSAPNFTPEGRATEVTVESPTTEVFTLVPHAGSVSGKVVSARTSRDIRGASVQLEATSGIYFGTTYDAVTGADGMFSLSALPSTINYQVTVSKSFYDDYQDSFGLGAGEAKDLGTLSLSFTDDDGDGLPDTLEQIIVDFDPEDGITTIADVRSDDDFDGDGKTNGEEFLSGTAATSESSYLKIVGIASNTSDSITLFWTTVSGTFYAIYYGNAMTGWSLIASDIPASGTGQNSWTDDSSSGTDPPPDEASIRFYRVEGY